MASGFWYLEDGRGFARNVFRMVCVLQFILDELKHIRGAESFHEHLLKYIPAEDDIYNGYGGFIKKRTGESIMFVMDIREFTPENREYFWRAAQHALQNIITEGKQDEYSKTAEALLMILLDMHKRITRGEDPAELNDMRSVMPFPAS